MRYVKRFFKAPTKSFFLFGPRGTGKSTWLKECFPDAIWIDLLDSEQLRLYIAYPEKIKETLEKSNSKIVVIDEVQKVPDLLLWVHKIIEEKRGYLFVLTGSSSRKLKREGVDLLAGRALLCHMHPFIATEMGDEFALEDALRLGMLPLVRMSDHAAKDLRTYISMYLKEEVQAEGLVRNLGSFARFLEVISFSHGAPVNATNIGKKCGVKRSTVENFIQILQDLLLAFLVPVFQKRAHRELSVHPKFYLFDAGVYRSLRPKGPLDHKEEIEGIALEGLVAQHLRCWIDSQDDHYALYFWRTRTGEEVDFIVYGDEGFWAIEVKNAKRLAGEDFKGLKLFVKDYPECKPLILYRGKEKGRREGIPFMPCEEFLMELYPDKSLTFE